ncbi:DUF2341 domain-containing protein [Candidatus Woesearchaeota archaeon]|nr:DUF2341 domain-containing protein [Candidatus Woesearchaeota archaeon]
MLNLKIRKKYSIKRNENIFLAVLALFLVLSFVYLFTSDITGYFIAKEDTLNSTDYTLCKKIKEDARYDAILDSTSYDDQTKILTVIFHHDYNKLLPISVKGRIKNYTLDKDMSVGHERVTLKIRDYNNEYFRILVGSHTEAFELGQARKVNITSAVKDAGNNTVDADMEIIDSLTDETKAVKQSEEPIELDEGEYNIKVKPSEHPVKEIEFKKMEFYETFSEDINLDDLTETEKNPGYLQLYAIDPTNLNFTNATVTVTAKGTKLYKCREWNFTEQSCFGEWILFKDNLVQGQEYTFTLTPDDPGFGESGWWNLSFPHRMNFTIDHDYIDSDLKNWTLILTHNVSGLQSSNSPLDADGNSSALNGGGDIRFTDDGENRLAIDIRTFSTDNDPSSADMEIAVLVPNVSSTQDTVIWMYWGNSTASQPSAGSTYGQYNAYDSDHRAVYIFKEATSGDAEDRTSNGDDLAIVAGGTGSVTRVTGGVGYAWQFDGNTDDATLGRYAEYQFASEESFSQVTWEALTKVTSIANVHAAGYVSTVNTGRSSTNRNTWQVDHSVLNSFNSYGLSYRGTEDDGTGWELSTNFKDTDWHYYAMTQNSSHVLEFWRDGTAYGTTYDNGGDSLFDAWRVNVNRASNRCANGIYSEVRFSEVQRSDAWLKADYNNLMNMNNFVSGGTIGQADNTDPSLSIWKNTSVLEFNVDSIVINWTASDTNLDTALFNITYPNGTILYESASSSGSITLDPSNLTSQGTYDIYLKANDTFGNQNSTSESFNVTDMTSPAITNVNATDITNQSANITWNTNELANSSVNYGTTTSLGTTEPLDDSTTSHFIQLTSLTNNTLYYYNVTSCDSDNNCNTTGYFNFTTLQTAVCDDDDGDGYGVCPNCNISDGCAFDGDDCNDTNASINPGANETCNNVDDNCDTNIDEGGVCPTLTYYCDNDTDTYIDSTSDGSCSTYNCVPINCTTVQGNDCNDTNTSINPAASDICNGIDDDCNGTTADGSGEAPPNNDKQAGVCIGSKKSCTAGSWQNDYTGIANYEDPESSCADTLDNDCDGDTDSNDNNCIDSTPPSITITTPSGNYNQNDTVPFNIETNENATVTATITYPNSTKTTIQLIFNGTQWYYKNNFQETLLPRNYNIVINATDNAGNSNTTSGSFNILDISNPSVTNVQPNNKNFSQNSTISINATVIDPYYDSITEVKANITWNTSFQTITLNKNNGLYTGTFSNTSIIADYNITIIAKDSSNNTNDTEKASFYIFEDIDQDNKADDEDYLIFNEDDVSQSGINLDIKVNNNTDIDGNSWSGTNTLGFYDGANILMNFTHNFSNTSKIYLSEVSIEIINTGTNQGIAVNLSSQLLPGETKTLFIQDNNFISLCVKDDEISQVAQITNDCTGNNETDFTTCLGNSAGYTKGSITCTDLGNWIKVENLTYSGIKGTISPAKQGEAVQISGSSYGSDIYCGDGICTTASSVGEDCSNCPEDCGECPVEETLETEEPIETEPAKKTEKQVDYENGAHISDCIFLGKDYGRFMYICSYWWILIIILAIIFLLSPLAEVKKKRSARKKSKKLKKKTKRSTKKRSKKTKKKTGKR